jgi:hypothetical protein
MKLPLSVLPAIAFPALALLAAPAHAGGGFEFSFGKKTKHGSFGVTYSTGHARPVPVAHCPPPRVWVPGHYETRFQDVWVPGPSRQVWVPPVYAWRHDACGRAYQVCVRPGSWRTECAPGRYERREIRVWVDGCWR